MLTYLSHEVVVVTTWRAVCQLPPVGDKMRISKRGECRLYANILVEDRETYMHAADRLGVSGASFVGLLARLGYERLLNEPEILGRVIIE